MILSCSLGLLLVWMMICYTKFVLGWDSVLQFTLIDTFSFHLRLSRLSLLFCGVIVVLYPIALLYAVSYFKVNTLWHPASFYGFFNLVITSGIGLALSGNLLTMFMFYELITLTTYPIIATNHSDAARSAASYYLKLLLSSSTLSLLPAVIYTAMLSNNLEFSADGIFKDVQLSDMQCNILLLMFVFGIAKTAILPLHTWLLRAMVAPAPVSSILHAVVVVKSGIFMLINVVFHVFGGELLHRSIWRFWGCNWLFWIAACTIIYSGIRACYSSQLKQRLAYSTIAQLAYATLSISLFSFSGKVAAMAQIIAHALAKINLFFGAGAIYCASGKNAISSMRSVFYKMRGEIICMGIAAVSLIGLPFTIGFHSKHYIILGILGSEAVLTYWLVLIVATTLTALYMLPMLYTFFVDDQREECNAKPIPRLISLSMFLCTVAMLLAFCVNAGKGIETLIAEKL